MEERGLSGMFVGADASWEYLSGAKRIGRDKTCQRQNSLEYACLLVTEKDVVLFVPRLTSLGILPFLPENNAVTKQVVYPDEDLTGETFVTTVRELGLSDKAIGVNRDITPRRRFACKTASAAASRRLGPHRRHARRQGRGGDRADAQKQRNRGSGLPRHYADGRPGTMVREIEYEIEKLFEKYGCSMPSCPAEAIVLGPASGPVFGMNYDRVEKGYSFAFDFGGVYQGYCSDFGRTVFVGEPDPEIVRYYELVRASQKAGLEAFHPGVSTCEEVNLAARRVIEEAGYGANFIHRLGHGIGKDVHERPFLAMGEKTVTMPGMTFTDEPSIIFVRRCCVRLEDVVLVTENGCEDLNTTTKELVVVD
jgi:Xaa-Pro aminopeptidase